jgi:uncharacterized membrane protein YhaH (DUF805 family)
MQQINLYQELVQEKNPGLHKRSYIIGGSLLLLLLLATDSVSNIIICSHEPLAKIQISQPYICEQFSFVFFKKIITRGGLVLVPFFALLFAQQGIASELVMLMAVATSLATIIVTSIATVLAHQRLGAVIWPYVWRLSAGIVLGVVAGAYAADYLLSANLRFIFALYMLYVAVQMENNQKPNKLGQPLT